MRLLDYFEMRRREGAEESYAAFARRAVMPESTVRSIVHGGGATAENIVKIEAATQGLVTAKDLTPSGK
jgi:DNA-binding transcriptional regulator YdaS (Cro superfamily)